jgi:hypothetical protein
LIITYYAQFKEELKALKKNKKDKIDKDGKVA